MADLPVTPLANYGDLLSSQTTANANAASSYANAGLASAQTTGANLANQKSQLQLDVLKKYMSGMQAPAVNDSTPMADASGTGGGGGSDSAISSADAGSALTNLAGGASDAGAALVGGAGGGAGNIGGAGDDSTPTLATGGTPASGGAGGGTSAAASIGLDPGHIDQTAQRNFAVKPIWTPQELQQYQTAATMKMMGLPDLTANVTAMHDARIQTASSKAQLAASNFYDQSDAIAKADPGTALGLLKAYHPDMGNQIDQLAKKNGWTPEQTDGFVRQYATEAGNAAHRYSGREITVGTDGVARDAQTNNPVLGGNPTGLSSKDWSELGTKADAIVTVTRNGREMQVPQWQADGATSKAQWVNMQGHQANIAAGSAAGTAPAANTSGTAPAAAPATAPAAKGGSPNAGTLPSQLTPTQQAYVQSGPKAPAFLNTGNAKPSPGEVEAQTAYTKATNALLSEATTGAQTAQTTLVNVNRAAAALDKSTTLGPGSAGWAEVQTVFRNWTGQQAADAIENSAAMRQLLGKELGQDQLNTILSKLHGEGAQVRLGAQESGLILNSLSANPDLSRFAVKQMLDWEKSDAQYEIGKSRAARAWVNAGNDSRQFDYEDRFPRPSNVQTGMTGEAPPNNPPGVGQSGQIQRAAPVTVKTAADYAKLKSGQTYVDPNGVTRTKG